MYLGVDVGGTKTLVAVLDELGVITEEVRFETPEKYQQFLSKVQYSLNDFKCKDFQAAVVGVAAITIDRIQGKASNFPHIPSWPEVNIAEDIESITNCPVFVENDAKLAGLSEAMLLKDKYKRVFYITISTGIGLAFINNLEIDTNAGDAGGEPVMLEHAGMIVGWESFASGKSIAERFGKMAKEINDEKTWKIITNDILKVLVEFIALFQPEVIVIGGSVGKYFDRYGDIIKQEIKKYQLPLIKTPVFIGAQRPDNSVIYGCYDYAQKRLSHAVNN